MGRNLSAVGRYGVGAVLAQIIGIFIVLTTTAEEEITGKTMEARPSKYFYSLPKGHLYDRKGPQAKELVQNLLSRAEANIRKRIRA